MIFGDTSVRPAFDGVDAVVHQAAATTTTTTSSSKY